MAAYTRIGEAPYHEAPAEVRSPGYAEHAQRECQLFIEAIRNYLGPEVDGACLAVECFPCDDGHFYEVVCYFDPAKPASGDYARLCERSAPATWKEGRVSPPPPSEAVQLTQGPKGSRRAAVQRKSKANWVEDTATSQRAQLALVGGNPPKSDDAAGAYLILGERRASTPPMIDAPAMPEEYDAWKNRMLPRLRKTLGPEPEGADLDVLPLPGRGAFRLICRYDRESPGSIEYAFQSQRQIADVADVLGLEVAAKARARG